MSKPRENPGSCLTCYGAGEVVRDDAAQVCPDCFGEGSSLSQSTKMEWRLREIERTYRSSDRETARDVLWLVNELRTSREALVRILARCQDADDADSATREIKFLANETLGLYNADGPGTKAPAR